MLFWITVAALAVLVGSTLAISLLRGRDGGARPAAAYDLEVYRDQMGEIDRDRVRGVASAEEAERLRAEVGRRILAADAALKAAESGRDATRSRAAPLVAGGLAVLVVGGALFLYTELGAPGYGDLPLELRLANAQKLAQNRMTQDKAEAGATLPAPDLSQMPDDYMNLVKRLRQVVETRPDDQRGLALLAQNEGRLGNWSAARKAQQKLIAVKGKDAGADDYATLADMMINAAGGYVSSDAANAVNAALQKDPRQPLARYFLGLYSLQVDRPDKAFEVWQALLEDSRPDAPWVTSLRAQLPLVAQRAGVQRYQLPPMQGAAPGPDASQVQAAGQMSAGDRKQMISGMVERLAGRLETQGGTGQEWARLVTSYGVLGEADKARAALLNARKSLKDQPDELTVVNKAASGAGISVE